MRRPAFLCLPHCTQPCAPTTTQPASPATSLPGQNRSAPGPSTAPQTCRRVMWPHWRRSKTAVAKSSGQRAACLEPCSGGTRVLGDLGKDFTFPNLRNGKDRPRCCLRIGGTHIGNNVPSAASRRGRGSTGHLRSRTPQRAPRVLGKSTVILSGPG